MTFICLLVGSRLSGANLTPHMIQLPRITLPKVSKHLKLPIFSRTAVPRIFGVNLALASVALSVVAIPTHAFDYGMPTNASPVPETPIVVTTQSAYHFPLALTTGMSQPFHALHPGVDLKAPIGTPVLSMDDGTVIEVEYTSFGYGHYVRIAHDGAVWTLYAHLSKTLVKPGEHVTRGQQIGAVGVTGWSTGPHLHFEVHEGDQAVNPLTYIGNVPFSP